MIMEDQGAERSSIPSGSEDVDSDDSKRDEENGRESENENGKDDSDADDSDASEGESTENCKSESEENRNPDLQKHYENGTSGFEEGYDGMDSECYPLGDLPLEVITTVDPTNYAYPVLKNMSNGVLTHRNIFTEFERSVLINIINKYRNIVDTRSRTREIYLEKQNVWQQIVEEYNGTESIMVRTEKELRKCWDNMKYRAKQAEKEMVKTEVEGEEEAGAQAQVKTEPPDMHDLNNMTAAYEAGGGEDVSWASGEGGGDDEREPALKRARQESPKLSSLLMAAAHKRSSPSKKSGAGKSGGGGGGSHKSSSNNHYGFPECSNKIQHNKKKNHPLAMTTLNMAALSEIPILPKGLSSCLSITNIPNPVSIAGHLTAAHAKNSLSPSHSPNQTSIKPMPSLKKMVPSKHQSSNSKNATPRSLKKSNGLSSKARNHSPAYHNLASSADNNGPNSIAPTPNENDNDRAENLADRTLSARLTTQRLEQERREHELRMKLLEKELQAHSFQSQYWSLKLKLLRSGRENAALSYIGATNGDID